MIRELKTFVAMAQAGSFGGRLVDRFRAAYPA